MTEAPIKKGRGRPRTRPYCPKCNKPLLPGQLITQGYHAACTEGIKLNIPTEQAEVVETSAKVEKIITHGKRRGRPPKNAMLQQKIMKSPNDTGGRKDGYTAREASRIISDTVGRICYVIKFEDKFYISRDTEKCAEGNGFDNPTRLLACFLKKVGMLKIGQLEIFWED